MEELSVAPTSHALLVGIVSGNCFQCNSAICMTIPCNIDDLCKLCYNQAKKQAEEVWGSKAPRAKMRKSAMKCPISEFYLKICKTPKLKGTHIFLLKRYRRNR